MVDWYGDQRASDANTIHNAWMNESKPWENDANRWYNPYTNERFVERLQGGGMYTPGSNEVPRYRPPDQSAAMQNYMRDYNMGRGDGGGFDYQPFEGGANVAQYTGGSVAGPSRHAVNDFSQSMVDVTDLIDAESRLSDQRREAAWADAGARFGASGSVASTPYMGHLAGIAADEQARQDQIFGQLRFQSGTDFANRQLQEEMQQRQLEQQAWAQYEQMNQGSQMANMQRDLGIWDTTNQMNMFNTGLQFQGNQAANQFAFQDYQNNPDQLAMYMAAMGLGGMR